MKKLSRKSKMPSLATVVHLKDPVQGFQRIFKNGMWLAVDEHSFSVSAYLFPTMLHSVSIKVEKMSSVSNKSCGFIAGEAICVHVFFLLIGRKTELRCSHIICSFWKYF